MSGSQLGYDPCSRGRVLTWLVQHLVTFIEDEVLQACKSELLVTNKGVNTSWCAHNDVGVGVLVGQDVDVLLDRGTTVEHGDADVRQELGKAVVLVLDLESQLTGVAHDQDSRGARLRLLVHLLEGGQHEDGRLSETRLGLAKHVVS
jgi:hypothetical protein